MKSPQRWADKAKPEHPGQLDPKALKWFRRLAGPVLRRFHRPRMEGIENIPRDRPFMLVANHSGGVALSEICCLVLLGADHFEGVPVAALAHPAAFHFWPLPIFMKWTGAVPSSYAAAEAALDQGCSLLIFPGGEYEVSRPFWQANLVDWNGRQGFLKIARQANVPIVPMGIRGSHWSCPTLWRSTWFWPRILIIPWIFGLKRWPVTLTGALGMAAAFIWGPAAIGWPLSILAAWAWMISLIPLFPWVPVTIRYRVGAPIEPETLFAGDLDAAYAEVIGAVKALVDPDHSAPPSA